MAGAAGWTGPAERHHHRGIGERDAAIGEGVLGEADQRAEVERHAEAAPKAEFPVEDELRPQRDLALADANAVTERLRGTILRRLPADMSAPAKSMAFRAQVLEPPNV